MCTWYSICAKNDWKWYNKPGTWNAGMTQFDDAQLRATLSWSRSGFYVRGIMYQVACINSRNASAQLAPYARERTIPVNEVFSTTAALPLAFQCKTLFLAVCARFLLRHLTRPSFALAQLLEAIANNDREVSPSMLYAAAAVLEGCSFVNGGSQNTMCGALLKLAEVRAGLVQGWRLLMGMFWFKERRLSCWLESFYDSPLNFSSTKSPILKSAPGRTS